MRLWVFIVGGLVAVYFVQVAYSWGQGVGIEISQALNPIGGIHGTRTSR